MDVTSRVTSKGQVTIPIAVRRALHLDTGDDVVFVVDDSSGAVVAHLRKSADFAALAGSVPVPAEWKDASWAELREAAWSRSRSRQDLST